MSTPSFPSHSPSPKPTALGGAGMNRPLLTSALVAALGGLLFGFDTAVISGAEQTLQTLYNLSGFWHGFTTASALIGTILGALIAGKPADAFGRRTTLFWIGVFYFVSAVGSAFAWDWYSFVFFRWLGGLGVGAASVVSPLYIAEISPAASRGRLVALAQFNIVLGILLAFLSNYIIDSLSLGETAWRWMFGVEAFPAALFFALLFLVPRSPRWLVSKGRSDEAGRVLQWLRHPNAAQELAEIQASLAEEARHLKVPFFQAKFSKPILLAVAIAAFNQLSGINAILYYSTRIFEMAGAGGANAALLSSVWLGLTNLIFTMAALLVIDHFGRRKLMLVGSLGYIVSLGATAWAFYTYGTAFDGAGARVVLASLVLFIASHAFGQGAVIWVFISEIFPNSVRARGQALGSSTHWIMAALISWTFPIFAEQSGGHTFAFYMAMMVLQLVWVLRVMPETKGIPLEHIQKKLGIE